jgi:hypothetical protein
MLYHFSSKEEVYKFVHGKQKKESEPYSRTMNFEELFQLVVKRLWAAEKLKERPEGRSAFTHWGELRDKLSELHQASNAIFFEAIRRQECAAADQAKEDEERRVRVDRWRRERKSQQEREERREKAQKIADKAYQKALLLYRRKPWFVRLFAVKPQRFEAV